MSKPSRTERASTPRASLDLLILKTLSAAPNHGYGITKRIKQLSDDMLAVEEGALYPALHRLERDGALTSEWSPSESGRRVKLYSITKRGRSRLATEEAAWKRLAEGVARVLRAGCGWVDWRARGS